MRVRRIECNAFGVVGGVDLPERGLVVVTGPNMSGKSLIFVESVATALWGCTLRGESPWSSEGAEHYCAHIDGVVASRTRAKNKTVLAWDHVQDGSSAAKAHETVVDLGGADNNKFESTSKAQDALEAIIGSFDVWRRTRVFSSADAAHFSTATDGERKRLVEAVLGFEAFDEALDKCRTELRAVEKKVTAAEKALLVAQTSAASHQKLVERCQAALAGLQAAPLVEPIAPQETELCELQKLLESAKAALTRTTAELARANESVGAARSAAVAAERALAAVVNEPLCRTCGQELPQKDLPKLKKVAAESRVAADAAAATAHDKVAMLTAVAAEEGEEADVFARKIGNIQQQSRQYIVEKRAFDRWQHDLAQAEKDAVVLVEAQAEHAAALVLAQEQLTELAKQAAELTAVETVLGLRGVRSRLLSNALSGVQSVANRWLQRLAPPELSVEINGSRTKKNGREEDVLEILVSGRAYGGLSSGGRRRVDLSILLGLMAVASRGGSSDTIFLDECLDGLDKAGVEAAADVLEELAEQRCVVVLTHNDDLVKALPAAVRFHVEGGVCKKK